MLFCDGYASVGDINPLLSSGCFRLLQGMRTVLWDNILSALIFKVLQDVFEGLEVWRWFSAYGYGYRSNRLILLYQMGFSTASSRA